MSHIATNRRRLAAPEPEIITKPTVKRQINPSTTTKTSTVYNLTNHFSRLNPNPQSQKSLNYPPSQKLIDVHSQAKSLSKSAMLEPSNHGLTHKVVKKGKRVVLESGKEVKRVDKIGKNHEEGSKKELQVVKIRKPPKEVVVVRSCGVGNSKSLSDAQVELNNFLLTNSAKLVAADMPPFIQIHAVGFARKIKDSLEKFSSKNLALSLKKEFDGVYGPAWHCIVGSSFGSFVTHSVGGFLYFSLDQKLFILLFKTNVQRAD
ncbi:uncharacterized protein LOC141653156 [Silene latifolia]|uniref:uncharacterized protein LOC141653156 n=1 Tax=Silene latifolia TaxID=37657 RepID=UPI003D77FA3B